MPDLPVYEIKLPPEIDTMLKWMVGMVVKHPITTLSYNHIAENNNGRLYIIHAGDEKKSFNKVGHDVFYGLRAQGLIEFIEKGQDITGYSGQGAIFLTTLAYEWVNYQKKSPLKKWLYKYSPSAKDVALVVIGLFTFALTVLQIAQYLGWIKAP